MAFTSGSDVNFLSVSDNGKVVGAGAGDDLYIISPAFLPTGTVTLSDTGGSNTLKLTGGLAIASSKVAANSVQLTLSNGAIVNINGASSFGYEVGGHADTAGVVKTFTEFVTQTLGAAAVPTGTTVVDGAVNRAVAIDGSTPAPDFVSPALLGVAAGTTSVSVNFDEALQEVASGVLAPLFTVTATNAAGVVSNYPVDRATVVGSSVTLGLTQSLAGEKNIKVSYAGNALKDAAGNAVAAIDKALASTDVTAPTWTLTSPTDNTVGVAANANLTLTFVDTDAANAEAVTGVKLGTGNITIKSATETLTIPVTDANQVTFNATDKTLVINPTAVLKAGAEYTVTLDSGAVRDLAGNGSTVGGDGTQNFTVTTNKADTKTVELPAAGATAEVPLVNEDAGAPLTSAKNTGADTVVLATKPVAGSAIKITNFTLGAGTDGDTLKLGGYNNLTALAQDITKIKVTESNSLFAQQFNGRDLNGDGDFVDANEIAPKQFLDFEVTVNGATIKFDDLIALDVLVPSVKAMLPATFVAGTTDPVNSVEFANASDIATLVGTFADNLSFGA